MATFQDLREHHDKAIKVILSCKTHEQLEVADKYCKLMYSLHLGVLNTSTSSWEKPRYQTSLIESKKLTKEAMAFQLRRLRLRRKR